MVASMSEVSYRGPRLPRRDGSRAAYVVASPAIRSALVVDVPEQPEQAAAHVLELTKRLVLVVVPGVLVRS